MAGDADQPCGVKRKLDDVLDDSGVPTPNGMSNDTTTPPPAAESRPVTDRDNETGNSPDDAPDDWQSVDRLARKRQKKLDKNYPALIHTHNAKLNSFIKIGDLQNLALYLLADGPGPQWLSVRHHQNFSKVLVLMVPGLDADLFTGDAQLDGGERAPTSPTTKRPDRLMMDSYDMFPIKLDADKMPVPLQPLCDIFSHMWPVKTPGDYKRIHSPMYAMLSSPIARTKEEKSKKGVKPPAEGRGWVNRPTPVTDYLMTRSDLLENGFALHPAHLVSDAEREVERLRRHKAVQSPEDGFVDLLDIKTLADGEPADSDIESGSTLRGRRLLVLDCEMVTTTIDRFALARISLIDWDGKVVLDELVKPPDPVKDYLTPWSGITESMMRDVTTTLPEIQQMLSKVVTPHTILAGHSLDSDFRALKLAYPFVVDTTLLYPHPKGPPQKSSLKWLAQKYLDRDIQQSSAKGHDSVEDALACLDLIKQKCEKGKAWGTADAQGEPVFKRLARTGRIDLRDRESVLLREREANGVDQPPPRKTGAMVDWAGNMHGFAATAKVAIPCTSDAEVVRGVDAAINGPSHPTLGAVPAGGCDFVFARLRELEFIRGWSPAPSSVQGDASADVSRTSTALNAAGPSASYSDPDPATLARAVTATVTRIQEIYNVLPARTALIVFSGSGSPTDMVRMQKLHAAHREEFLTTKWDELKVQWTDREEQRLMRAVERAKRGVAFLGVK